MSQIAPPAAPSGKAAEKRLAGLMMSMFFAFGFCNVLVDTLVPKFKAMFSLSYTEVMLTQFCYFGAYFVVSAPAGWLVGRIGYLQSMALGLLLMALGAVGFSPASLLGAFPAFLAALFVLAAGVTIVEVAANPATAMAGPASGASSRLTLAQAFNSAATMVAPLFGAYFILGSVATPRTGLSEAALAAFRLTQAHMLVAPFAGVASVLVVLAALCWLVREWSPRVAPRTVGSWGRLLGEKYLMLGALAIFCYVGAEVSIGSSLTNYLMGKNVLDAAAPQAGRLVSLYWGGAMLGRFVGFLVLRHFNAAAMLALCAAGAASLTVLSGLSGGVVAATALLAVGLFNAIMFPTIFTLAIEGLGDRTPQASGLICLAIVGGAIVPLVMGAVADRLGLPRALIVPAVCYVCVGLFGLICLNRARL